MESKKYCYFIVEGNSMFPFLETGNTIKIIKTRNVKIGDIAVFMANSDRLIIHRVVKIKKDDVLTKGDNKAVFDPIFNKSKLIGKVIAIENKKTEQVVRKYVYPLIARFSYLQGKINPNPIYRKYFGSIISMDSFPQKLKRKIVGDRDLKIHATLNYILYLPLSLHYNFNKILFKLIKKLKI